MSTTKPRAAHQGGTVAAPTDLLAQAAAELGALKAAVNDHWSGAVTILAQARTERAVALQELAEVRADANRLAAQLAQVTRERDEARAQVCTCSGTPKPQPAPVADDVDVSHLFGGDR